MAKLVIEFAREGRMGEQELDACMRVAQDHHVVRGVFEIISRLEDAAIEDNMVPQASRDAKADAMNGLFWLREVRKNVISAIDGAKARGVT